MSGVDQAERSRKSVGAGAKAQADGERLLDVERVLADCPPVEPPPGFAAIIMRRVEAASGRLSLWRRWQRARRARTLTK